MSIRARVEDAMILFAIGRPEAALHSLLTAIAATSRRRRPWGTASQKRPGEMMGDGEAFELFLHDEMVRMCRVQNYNVKFRGELHRLEHILYKWLRCELAHEARLPLDIAFAPSDKPGTMSISVSPDGLVLTHGWLDALADAVIYVPENADEFGTPAKPPLPIHLPLIGLTVGSRQSETSQGTSTQ